LSHNAAFGDAVRVAGRIANRSAAALPAALDGSRFRLSPITLDPKRDD
jgi:hypothetical protein